MDLSSGHSENEQPQISLAYLPPTPLQTRSALAGGAVLLIALAALAPFAGKPLPQANGFIPALDAIIFVTDLITASIFLAHFSINRSRALLVLACGYLFSALMVAAHVLTFPEAFSQPADLARAARINFMIYLVWHLGLPAALFGYVWLRGKERTTPGPRTPAALVVVISSVAGVFALVGCLVWLAAAGDKLLPPPQSTFHPFPVPITPWLVNLTMLVCVAAFSVLWLFRRSVLDQWLMVVVLASMIELAITGRLGWHHFEHSGGFESRFTLGFYAGRSLFSLLTSTFVLIALLAETTKLYAGVARANVLARIVNASQSLSREVELPNLIVRLMTIAFQNAGAHGGLLILPSADGYQVRAEARAAGDLIEVTMRREPATTADLAQSAVQQVISTQKLVLLDDASADDAYSKDEYIRRKNSRSVLCLPIVKQAKLVGVLYLENNLAPFVFTPDRVAVLQLLASQAAISLENAALYTDLQLQVGLLQLLPVSAWTLKPDGTPDFVNQVWLEFSGQILDFVRSHPEAWMAAVHPEDREAASRVFWDGVRSGQGFSFETRSLRAKDGTYRWHLQQAVVLRDAEGKVLKFVGTTTDIDDQKRAEEKIRQSEKEARQLLDLSPIHIGELGPDGARLYTNRASLDYYGISLEEWRNTDLRQVLYPQDAEFVAYDLPKKLQAGSAFEYEVRLKRKDGQYRWFHYRLSPMSDDEGRITRWYGSGTDIDDRKLAEQRLLQQNVALREEVDKASMFEEIVGTSAPLKNVLSRISKVAPTDSSVLITGETGTGKELVARAIHKRSQRSSHAFVSVNCAAMPRDLIASELFGHEKGAFTGATQRRFGRFELAEKGTIFLDEVGELPEETQIALLRVLQERQFERIGGTGTIRADVRVIAATNRDLESAIEAGTFRGDLFYRLNVFPIELPPLRKRNEDIPLLIAYFLNRYARKAGRHFTVVDKKSLDLLQSYAWPGNIRELQNVIERSVIVSESQTFSVDESWLSHGPSASDLDVQPSLFNRLPAQEKAAIEAALLECGGRVYGPEGAAVRLGIPRTTLESKIKSLKINKNRFKPDLLKDS
jgi:PAS domain S-box-containing protein